MGTIYTVKVAIHSPPMNFQQVYKFAKKEERDDFVERVKGTKHIKVTAISIEHLFSVAEAIEDCTDESRWFGFV